MHNTPTNHSSLPFMTVLIPTYNEEKFIAGCLDSLLSNDYPQERLEIVVIDGGSSDRTREIVESYTRQYSFLRLLDNPRRLITPAINLGLKIARGEIIVILGAHARYDNAYLRTCQQYVQQTGADCVGGICETQASQPGLWPETIAAVLSHPLGAGNSQFRLRRQAQWVDTVPFGAYRREVFQRIGLFDERVNGSEDLEFNYRLRRHGGRIYMTPEIRSFYYSRATLRDLWKQHFRYGFSNIAVYRWRRQLFSWRHYSPLGLVLLLIASLISTLSFPNRPALLLLVISLYGMGLVLGSAHLAWKRGARYFAPAIIAASVIHISHGAGSLYGLICWGMDFIRQRLCRNSVKGV